MNTEARIEPWVGLDALAEHLSMSLRWVEYRKECGMPSAIIGGRRKVKITSAVSWLEKEGHIKHRS